MPKATPDIKQVNEATPTLRYVVRKDGKYYLGTPAGGQDLHFDSTSVLDALKFASPEDASTLLTQLFDVAVPMSWDAAKAAQGPDPDAPAHIGRFYGEPRGVLEIVSTHT